MFKNSRISVAILLAGAAIAGFAHNAVDAIAAPLAPQQSKRKNAHRPTSQFGGGTTVTKRGPGWSHAQVQRMARKRRAVARNKQQHRRARGFASFETLIGVVCISVWLAWFGSMAQKATDWHHEAPDTELRCVYGYQFIAGPDDTLVQLVDETGLGVRCDKPIS